MVGTWLEGMCTPANRRLCFAVHVMEGPYMSPNVRLNVGKAGWLLQEITSAWVVCQKHYRPGEQVGENDWVELQTAELRLVSSHWTLGSLPGGALCRRKFKVPWLEDWELFRMSYLSLSLSEKNCLELWTRKSQEKWRVWWKCLLSFDIIKLLLWYKSLAPINKYKVWVILHSEVSVWFL